MIQQFRDLAPMPQTLLDPASLNPGDLVLVTFEPVWFPVPCEVVQILETSLFDSGNLRVRPLIALTGTSVSVSSFFTVYSFNCRRLDSLTALQVVKACNELLSAVPTFVLDRSR
jgi:hypothetical protein